MLGNGRQYKVAAAHALALASRAHGHYVIPQSAVCYILHTMADLWSSGPWAETCQLLGAAKDH